MSPFLKRNHNCSIGVIAFATGDSGITPLSNIIDIILALTRDAYLITGNKGFLKFKGDSRIHVIGVDHERAASPFARMLRYIAAQIKISRYIVKSVNDVDLWIFFIGGDSLILPMIAAKLLRKKTYIVFAGSATQSLKSSNDYFYKIISILSNLNCHLSNRILLYSNTLIQAYCLEKHSEKIKIVQRHFLDFELFCPGEANIQQDIIVGYIGRLSEEKGILNLIQAINLLPDKIHFMIIGDGPLKEKIEGMLKEMNLEGRVKTIGWVQHDKLPAYLNSIKLLVIPSYTEGLPNVMIEAMACNVPVLANAVGAIPDIIIDEETGFLIKENNPSGLANEILRAISHHDLNNISDRGRNFVMEKFAFEKSVDSWRQIIASDLHCKNKAHYELNDDKNEIGKLRSN